uniref:Uncharacterized protein n=1 Tax=Plectus sambesii TaxID=2011161 RepID=A0A914W5G9_9BILA
MSTSEAELHQPLPITVDDSFRARRSTDAGNLDERLVKRRNERSTRERGGARGDAALQRRAIPTRVDVKRARKKRVRKSERVWRQSAYTSGANEARGSKRHN